MMGTALPLEMHLIGGRDAGDLTPLAQRLLRALDDNGLSLVEITGIEHDAQTAVFLVREPR